MRLVEQPMPQSYHLQDNGWTPLSQNPCWHRRYSPWPMFVYNDNLRVNIILLKIILYVGQVKSFVDDLKGTGYCKHESSLCATICWGSAFVLVICAWTEVGSSSQTGDFPPRLEFPTCSCLSSPPPNIHCKNNTPHSIIWCIANSTHVGCYLLLFVWVHCPYTTPTPPQIAMLTYQYRTPTNKTKTNDI